MNDPRQTAINRTQIRVLLVEDEEAHAELIQRAFEPQEGLMGLSVATNLETARRILEEEPPDLVLVDLVLPDGRGTELLPGEGEDAHFPFIVMTSHGDEKVAVEALRAGALHYVVKSVTTLSDMPQIVEQALREWGHVVERRRAEEALQVSEAHFRSLIENALDVIFEVDPDGTIHYSSPSIERVLGYSAAERTGANMFELIHPEDRSEVIGQLLDTFDEPGSTHSMEYRHRHKDGSIRILEAIASAHRQLRAPRRAVINARDVTDRKSAEDAQRRLQDQLRHSQKWEVVGTLAGGIANEFNNMLTPILGFATLAVEDTEPGTRIHKRLQHILTAANRSKDLAEQLLVFSRQAEPLREAVYLHEVVDEALKLLRPTLPPSIEIRRRIDTECDPVVADTDQIRQVIVNLCTNAYHAMPDGGVLGVEVAMVEIGELPGGAEASLSDPPSEPSREEADDTAVGLPDPGASASGPKEPGTYVLLEISDTGQGMDRDTRERMLEPFAAHRGDGDVAKGLGLAVTYGIVVSHGGELTVESEPDQGTVIRVYLPRARHPAPVVGGFSEAP